MKTMLILTVVALSASFASAAPACNHQAKTGLTQKTNPKSAAKADTNKGNVTHSKSNAEG